MYLFIYTPQNVLCKLFLRIDIVTLMVEVEYDRVARVCNNMFS